MSLRVVVPPHPLITHWLTVLRDEATPPALFASAMAELGRWLTYEALRDWLPHRPVTVQIPWPLPREPWWMEPSLCWRYRSCGQVWASGKEPRQCFPPPRVAHVGLVRDEVSGIARCYLDTLPSSIGPQVGVLVFDPMLATAGSLIQVLEKLEALGVGGDRLRVITAIVASPGLKTLGERFPQLTIYSACIDAELDDAFRIVPGLGDAGDRLFGSQQPQI